MRHGLPGRVTGAARAPARISSGAGGVPAGTSRLAAWEIKVRREKTDFREECRQQIKASGPLRNNILVRHINKRVKSNKLINLGDTRHETRDIN